MYLSGDLFSFRALGLKGALRQNIRILFRRANVLAWLIRRRWKIELKLSDLPERPVWHINATCFETGKNWRFTRDTMGDWKFGRHYSPDVRLADAIAASAAVPYVIGALKLALPAQGWWRTDPATKAPQQRIEPSSRAVRLWDGGAYENLALEPLYKPAEGLVGCDVLICSDASGPLGAATGIMKSLIRGKLASPRLFDISGDQIRALRSRMLMKSITQGEIRGYLFRLGTSSRDLVKEAGGLSGLTDEECAFCLNFPTSLSKVAAADFDLIARHGHEVARMTIEAFSNGADAL
jgi:NTE family protein